MVLILLPGCEKLVTIGNDFVTDCIQADWRCCSPQRGDYKFVPSVLWILYVHVSQSVFVPFSTDDDYSDTYNATYAVINSGERRFYVCYTISNFFPTHLSPPVWLALLHHFFLLCPLPNRWLQPTVVKPHDGPPCSPDTYVQASHKKPFGQRRASGASGAFTIPCTPTTSAHAISAPAEGERQWPRERLAWFVRGALSFFFFFFHNLLHLISYAILAPSQFWKTSWMGLIASYIYLSN